MSRTPVRRHALPALLITALTGGLLTAVSTTATADSVTTLRWTSTNPQNTDLDLGQPGPGPGDAQVFRGELRRDGRLIGEEAGSCSIAQFTATRLVVACTSTARFADGSSLTLQGMVVENPQQGPTSARWAITGGTGRYRSASGELTGRFVPNTDTVNVTATLTRR